MHFYVVYPSFVLFLCQFLIIYHIMFNNKLVFCNVMHGWRIFENLGIWGTVIIAYFMTPCCGVPMKSFFLLGIGAWLIGTFCYEAALNHIYYGKIWKPVDYRWHIFGKDIPWFGGKKSLILVGVGLIIILLGFPIWILHRCSALGV